MKSKFFAVILSAITLFLTVFSVPASAADADVKHVADGIIGFMTESAGAENTQALIDGFLTQGAGTTAEWYIVALAQSGEKYDFSSYVSALDAYISASGKLSATTAQKYALALLACGVKTDFVSETLDTSVGGLGVMSYIYGLHILNNGVKSDVVSKEGVVSALISQQLEGGGWAIAGSVPDVDVTAMALSALAPNADIEGVENAVSRALEFLSNKQLENGGYKSMMSDENPESTAQVLLALSSLGIDCEKDERFIKNGSTVIDAIMRFSVGDGSFAHVKDGKYNFSATVQVYYSLVGYMRMKSGKTPLLVLDGAADAKPVDDLGNDDPKPDGEKTPLGYKPIATMAIVGALAVACVVLILLKKKNYKNFIAAAIIAAGAIIFVWATDIKAPDDYYGKPTKKENAIGTVTMTIRCDTIVGKSDEKYIPSDGVILPVTSFDIEEGDTAYDILAEGARVYGISIDVSSIGYVSGIGYIYQLDFGQNSGWMYRVNGEFPSDSCTLYVLSDGDVIEWLYTLDIGNDLK